MLKRNLYDTCLEHLPKKETVIITGARQVGKTTLLRQLKSYLDGQGLPAYFVNLEDPEYLSFLNAHPQNLLRLFSFPGGQRVYVMVDEIQYLDNPTNFLKYIYDEYSDRMKLIVSGSSAFYMDKKFRDSLAGRKRIFQLYTLSLDEFLRFNNREDLSKLVQEIPYGELTIEKLPIATQRELSLFIDQYMIYGGYPRVVLAESHEEKVEILRELIFSYTKKDILESGIRDQQNIMQLLRVLSAQTGSLLNLNNLANSLALSHTAIENYLYVLKKSFHVATIAPYFTNVGKEIRKMPKLYFLDLGFRNVLLRDFNRLEQRQDAGALFENFIFRQFLDRLPLDDIQFWRTQQQNEVDFILDRKIAYEVKYSPGNVRPAKYKLFRSLHPTLDFHLVYHTGKPAHTEQVHFLRF